MPKTLPLTFKASYSKFERKIKLPSTVDRDSVKASYDNGLLAVSIPKNPKRQELKLRVPIA
jgi:HSP20 family protein